MMEIAGIDITQFIRPELLVMIPFLWCIGHLLKKHPRFEPWRVPFVLYAAGAIYAPLYLYATVGGDIIATAVTGVVQGVLTACAAVGLYEGYKGAKCGGKERKENNENDNEK